MSIQNSEDGRCINCGTDLTGDFCHSCGQKALVKRISIKTFFEDYLSRLFGMDTNFLRTIKNLTLRPGIVGRTFIEGNRVKYIGPVGYFFLMITLVIILLSVFDINLKDFMGQAGESLAGIKENQLKEHNLQEWIMVKISSNFKTFRFFIIVFLAIWSMMLYRKDKLNLFEHSVNCFYILGHLNLLLFAQLVIYESFGILITAPVILISSLYFGWSAVGFYRSGSKSARYFKGLLCYFISIASFILFLFIVIIVFIWINKIFNPEFMDQFK